MATRRGFTFIEVILVLAIIMVVGVSSVVFSNNFLIGESLEGTFEVLRSDIRKAQLYSMNGRNGSVWGVALRDGRLVLFIGTGYEYRDSAFDEIFVLPRGVTLSGFDEAVFARESGQLGASVNGIRLQTPGQTLSFSLTREGVLQRVE